MHFRRFRFKSPCLVIIKWLFIGLKQLSIDTSLTPSGANPFSTIKAEWVELPLTSELRSSDELFEPGQCGMLVLSSSDKILFVFCSRFMVPVKHAYLPTGAGRCPFSIFIVIVIVVH